MVQGWHRTQVPAGGRNVHLIRDDAGQLVLVVCANQVTESPERSATAQQFNVPYRNSQQVPGETPVVARNNPRNDALGADSGIQRHATCSRTKHQRIAQVAHHDYLHTNATPLSLGNVKPATMQV